MNSIRCKKLSTAAATVRAYLDMYEKDFNAVVSFFIQYINKRAPTLSVRAASVPKTKPAKWQKTNSSHGTLNGYIGLKKHSRKVYDSMSKPEWQH